MSEFSSRILEAIGDGLNGTSTAKITKSLSVSPQELGESFESLIESEEVLGFAGLWYRPEVFESARTAFLESLERLHSEHPRLESHPRERVAHLAGLNWSGKPLDRILARMAEAGDLHVLGTEVSQATFRPQLNPKQQIFLNRVTSLLEEEGVNVSPPVRIAKLLSVPQQAVEEILRLGTKTNAVIELAEGVFYTPKNLDLIEATLREQFADQPFTLDQARDALQTTRKYLVPIFEQFDEEGTTLREGSERILTPGPLSSSGPDEG